MVQRRLTISGSDQYGLPTALDDEVILGLLQITSANSFSSPTIDFTRYELLEVLGWPHTSSSYVRVHQSLNRWLGVTLYYKDAWWNRRHQAWESEGFHILEHVSVLDRKKRERRLRRRKAGEPLPKCSITWNRIVFESFQAGNLKKLDMEFYRSLKSQVSKRIYRFLDKRFWKSPRFTMDLRDFGCDHLGLSKSNPVWEIKRRVQAGVEELVEKGFLGPQTLEERFVRRARGRWDVVLLKASSVAVRPHTVDANECTAGLLAELVRRGINKVSARDLAASYAENQLREKIAIHDWLLEKKDPRIARSPSGFLYRSIVDGYEPPE